MSPFEHGEVFVLDDGGEVCASPPPPTSQLERCRNSGVVFPYAYALTSPTKPAAFARAWVCRGDDKRPACILGDPAQRVR